MIPTLLIPIAKSMPLYVANQQEVPWALRSYVAGAFGSGAIPISEIGHIYGGRDSKPKRPLMIFCPNTKVISFIVGGGEAEAAELEELAYIQTEKLASRPMAERTAEYRERMGRPRREDAPALISEALRSYGRDRLANPSKYPKKPKPDRSWIRRLPHIPEA